MLVPSRGRLPDGSTAYEVPGGDIKKRFTPEFWIAVRFWSRCKRFGLPRRDWRRMTCQQVALVELFDALQAQRDEAARPKGA